jgi:flagellar basal body rod protein FlgG
LAAPLIGSFVPTVGETFTVLSAGSIAGTFSNTTIAINSSEFYAISYTKTGVVLTVTSSTDSLNE